MINVQLLSNFLCLETIDGEESAKKNSVDETTLILSAKQMPIEGLRSPNLRLFFVSLLRNLHVYQWFEARCFQCRNLKHDYYSQAVP
jgi:hypothetical protein